MPIKVVLDTNIVVSANLVDEGPSAAILALALNKNILMVVSPAVLEEYERVFHRARLKLDFQMRGDDTKKFVPLNRIPPECRNVHSVQARLP
jgi:putative PIN family toxin of toxin-antitoxin system